MKIQALVLALGGLVGAASIAQAQSTALPPGPLEQLQDEFGAIVHANFAVPNAVVVASPPGSPGAAAGAALRTSIEVPGAVFAGIVKPFADADAGGAPAPAAAVLAPRHHRHAHLRRHRRVSPAIG